MTIGNVIQSETEQEGGWISLIVGSGKTMKYSQA